MQNSSNFEIIATEIELLNKYFCILFQFNCVSSKYLFIKLFNQMM
jgi:hypothetical protein